MKEIGSVIDLGTDLAIEIEDMPSYPEPDLNRIFIGDIIYENTIQLEKCLDEDELDSIRNIEYGGFNNAKSYSPEHLKNIFKKIYDYLKSNRDTLPVIHWLQKKEIIDGGRICYEGSQRGFFEDGGIKKEWYIRGDSYDLEHRDELNVSIRVNESVKEEFSIKVEPIINMWGEEIVVRTKDQFEMHGELLEETISFCDVAIQNNKRIRLWYC